MVRRRVATPLLVSLAGGASALLLAALREPYRLQTTAARIALPRDCATGAGLRLAYLTDFHVGGPGPSEAITRRAIAQVATWRPHVVLLGGDYFDQGHLVETDAFDGLRDLGPVFAVLGNHDHRQGEENARAIVRLLTGRGIEVLRNQRVTVQVADAGEIEIVGLDDPYTGLHDAGLLAEPPGRRLRILLAHAPSVIDSLPVGCADLALFGHTHWGQVRLTRSRTLNLLDAAWYLDRIRNKPHARLQRGWFWERGMLVYVSRGIGQTQLPVRLFAPPEIVLLELDPATRDPRWPCDDPRHYVSEQPSAPCGGVRR